MQEDRWLIAVVVAVWTALAVAYATVPALDMPGSARLWGTGAAFFFVLWIAMSVSVRLFRRRQKP
jgi:hypothetical protein